MNKTIYTLITMLLMVCGIECSAQTVSGQVEGHDYVDLGLPSGTKWATYNIGATKPTEYGDYFAWGETKPQRDYSWDSYKWCHYKSSDGYGDPTDFNKYVTDSKRGSVDNKTVLDAEDDAATTNWGSAWRTPTEKEMTELKDGCNWEWTDNYNETKVTGMIGRSKTNGNTIFLPAAQSKDDEIYTSNVNYGKYLTCSLHQKESILAIYLFIEKEKIGFGYDSRCYGMTVRSVLK
ncbi:MAG: hypothetical protein KBT32_00800 [Bacteroidales bacterium]|nr:hypothetical protein [Candidatus Physcocola equi]